MSFKNVADIYVLSPMQQGLLFHTLYAPASDAYLIQAGWEIRGTLQASLFKQAWLEVAARHPILRTSFVWDGLEKPLQVVHEQVELAWSEHDWRALAPDEQHAHWERALADDRAHTFRLDRPPLMRFALFRLANDTQRFLWSYHHILLDGWSYPLVVKDVFDTYGALCQGQRPVLEERRPYRDYIAWLEEQDTAQAEGFWRRALADFTTPTRLTVENAPASGSDEQQPDFARRELTLSQETGAALQAFARRQRLTLNTLVQGAWALLLGRYSGESDLVYGSVMSGRPATLAGVEDMIGLFVNTLPVRVRLSPETRLLPWLQELQRQLAELRRYEYSPLVQIQEWSTVPRGQPLFESILAFENYPTAGLVQENGSDLEIAPVAAFTQTHYPLELIVIPRATLTLHMKYDRRRFADATIGRMLDHMRNLLEALPTHAEEPIAYLPLLSAAERQLILSTWSGSEPAEKPADDAAEKYCVHHLVELQAERSPDAPAVVFGQQKLTYAELNARANRLAHYLQRLGVGPEVLVGVCLERSLELVVCLLAILKAGGAYLPLDVGYPAERLSFMLADAGVELVLTKEHSRARITATGARVLCLERLEKELAQLPDANVLSEVCAQNLAYVMYTSGSTGQPKGIGITHRNIIHLISKSDYAPLTPRDHVGCVSSVVFDVLTFEVWDTLTHGAQLVCFDQETLLQPQVFMQELQVQRVSVAFLTTTLFNQIMQHVPTAFASLRQLLVGGEALDPHWIRKALEVAPPQRLVNAYGPTEATTFALYFPVSTVAADTATIPIGRPITGTEAYVLDARLQPLPIGVTGELYLGGPGLARCYFNRPELTAERFMPHPFSRRPGARLYRTGDLARYRPDGMIEYLGRCDTQIKLRGFRIESGEIEARLVQHPAVQEATVIVREDRPGDRQLVAYLVPASIGERAVSASALRQFLQQWLPEYMLPSAYVWLEKLPVTPSGKLDRRALPTPERARQDDIAYMAPRTPVEQHLARLWADLFGLERVGVNDNFFNLGGHSILALRLIGQIRAAFQVQLSLRTLFDQPTVAGLALAIVQEQLAQQESAEVERLLGLVEQSTQTADK